MHGESLENRDGNAAINEMVCYWGKMVEGKIQHSNNLSHVIQNRTSVI
jgi:hypothetical protein